MPPEEKKLNRLARETSPYLRQHATNPVDWYPWGEEALRKAKELDRPIFLSIGYSSCHWCHVMERESFENEETARIMNEHFINIKVDREERPDLDAIYMSAVQLLTGSGGWPTSVFLTPDLKPFWGGTYFPPDSRYGRPGFPQILDAIAKAYRNDRERIETSAAQLMEHICEDAAARSGGDLPGEDVIRAAVEHDEQTFDEHDGGFGLAPKFPRSIELSLLLRYHQLTGDSRSLLMCEKTLEAMARGGMYDQIGGGFHRYSTDAQWLVPHFEKMLYDNALLTRTYVEAWQVTGTPSYREIACDVLDYVLGEMRSPEGGFYSSTDADSDGEEGKFFVWSPDEVEAVLGKEDARIVCEWYGITIGGNFHGRKSIPHVARSAELVSRALGVDPARVEAVVRTARGVLYRAREARVKPFRDEKVLASWNALMISALARAAQAFDEPRYLDAARKAAALVLEKLCPGGRLHRSYMEGQARIPAYLDDHAYLAEALIDLYEATFETAYLSRARQFVEALLEQFWDAKGGGFFYTATHHDSLIARTRDETDSSTPSGGGVAAMCLLRLERLTGEKGYRERAEACFRSMGARMTRFPMGFGATLLALDFLLHPPVEIALVGDLGSPEGKDLLRVVYRRFLPRRVIAGSPAPVPEGLARTVPLLEGKKALDGKPTAYVCRDFSCRAPTVSPAELERQLQTAEREPSRPGS